jgi:hypothetical protein
MSAPTRAKSAFRASASSRPWLGRQSGRASMSVPLCLAAATAALTFSRTSSRDRHSLPSEKSFVAFLFLEQAIVRRPFLHQSVGVGQIGLQKNVSNGNGLIILPCCHKVIENRRRQDSERFSPRQHLQILDLSGHSACSAERFRPEDEKRRRCEPRRSACTFRQRSEHRHSPSSQSKAKGGNTAAARMEWHDHRLVCDHRRHLWRDGARPHAGLCRAPLLPAPGHYIRSNGSLTTAAPYIARETSDMATRVPAP